MTLASLLCAVTQPAIFLFLSGRALQAFSRLDYPLSQTLLMPRIPESAKSFAVSLWSIGRAESVYAGSNCGGFGSPITWAGGAAVLSECAAAVAGAALVWALLFDRQSPQRKMPFDVVGFLLLAAAGLLADRAKSGSGCGLVQLDLVDRP